MAFERKRPADIAHSLSQRSRATRYAREQASSAFRRETFTMPRAAAREKAREWFDAFPKQAYMTEIESWRELADGQIEFTIRRLPSAD